MHQAGRTHHRLRLCSFMKTEVAAIRCERTTRWTGNDFIIITKPYLYEIYRTIDEESKSLEQPAAVSMLRAKLYC